MRTKTQPQAAQVQCFRQRATAFTCFSEAGSESGSVSLSSAQRTAGGPVSAPAPAGRVTELHVSPLEASVVMCSDSAERAAAGAGGISEREALTGGRAGSVHRDLRGGSGAGGAAGADGKATEA
jgi:hypothetical protein